MIRSLLAIIFVLTMPVLAYCECIKTEECGEYGCLVYCQGDANFEDLPNQPMSYKKKKKRKPAQQKKESDQFKKRSYLHCPEHKQRYILKPCEREFLFTGARRFKNTAEMCSFMRENLAQHLRGLCPQTSYLNEEDLKAGEGEKLLELVREHTSPPKTWDFH